MARKFAGEWLKALDFSRAAVQRSEGLDSVALRIKF
jgi:hypothetical protein